MASAFPYKSALVVLLLITSCSGPPHDDRDEDQPVVEFDLSEVRSRGYLNALVDNNSISYFYYKGGPMGYEYELLRRFCDRLNVDLRIKVITSIEEAIQLLNNGTGDVIAFPLTVTAERTQRVAFTDTHFNTSQVLVQRKPKDWLERPVHLTEKDLIRDPADLIGKKVYVKHNSSFKERMEHLSEEIGGDIEIIEDSASSETEALITQVAEGVIDYTVTDQTIAMVNAAYYPILDVEMPVSLPQRIAWAVRKNSPDLLTTINEWMAGIKKDGTFRVIFDRYFNSPRTSARRRTSDFSSLGGNKISVYDDLIKKKAEELEWDWRLLASLIYQESNFIPTAESWAGAKGLMQLVSSTGKYYGAKDIFDPVQNINAGVNFLKFLDRQWSKTISDKEERIKFMLASYNVGFSHVIDARNLTRKYGGNPTQWSGEVEKYLLLKSDPKYYRDPVVKAGYCRCEEPVRYVKEILERYQEYKRYIN